MNLLRTTLTSCVLAFALACGGASEPASSAPPAKEAAAEPAKEAPAEPAEAPAEPAAAEAGDAAAADIPAGNAEAGAETYKTLCVACHQADGKGMSGALGANFVDDATRLAKSDAQLFSSIKNGVEGTTMIAWGGQLDDQKIADVLAYIRATYGAK